MKKLLVVLLALVMVLAMATSAMAFTDTDKLSTVEQDGIYRLYALGVLNGYPDGSFGADKQITRAEFAKIACIVSGFGDVSALMKSTPSSFSDVAVGMWYTGYVNVAASRGFINGYPDGTFKPNNPISMAEVVTILMRIAGYNDNLPGPWPFDYIAEAGKQKVTNDVKFVSNVPATRAQVAVMTNNLLDVVLVDYDSDLSKFVKDADGLTVLEDSFGASIEDIMFWNEVDLDDAIDGWYYSDFDDKEISFTYGYYCDECGSYHESSSDLVMNENCYFAGGQNLNTIGGMEAEVIINDDDEVIYVKVLSTVKYTDDVEFSSDKLEIDGEKVDYDFDYADFSYYFEDEADYAKVFYNQDGEVYAIEDLTNEIYTNAPVIVDSYDAGDEILSALAGDDVELEDQDYVVMKDGKEIDVKSLKKGDIVYVFEPDNGADLVLLVGTMVKGKLTEGEDYTLTVGGVTYNFDSWSGSSQFTTGGIDGDYATLDSLDDLEDVFDATVQLALYRNPYEIAYLVSDVEASTSTVYGIVTDMTVGGLFNKVTNVTILNQEGKEVTYDLDSNDIFSYAEDGNIELGAYVEVKLDSDGVITDANKIVLAADDMDYYGTEMTVSGSKIKIGDKWYTVTKDTLFFEAVYDGDYYSYYFDEANLISVKDVLAADTITADVYVMNDGGTLERLYLVNSSINSGKEGYSFVKRLYTNSSGNFVELLDGTVAERKSGEEYESNTFYAYNIVDGKLVTDKIFYTHDSRSEETHNGSPVDDGYWVLGYGTLAEDGEDYALADFEVNVDNISGDILTLNGHYYTITSNTVIYFVDSYGDVKAGVKKDIKANSGIGAISDEDGNLLYVFVLEYYYNWD